MNLKKDIHVDWTKDNFFYVFSFVCRSGACVPKQELIQESFNVQFEREGQTRIRNVNSTAVQNG